MIRIRNALSPGSEVTIEVTPEGKLLVKPAGKPPMLLQQTDSLDVVIEEPKASDPAKLLVLPSKGTPNKNGDLWAWSAIRDLWLPKAEVKGDVVLYELALDVFRRLPRDAFAQEYMASFPEVPIVPSAEIPAPQAPLPRMTLAQQDWARAIARGMEVPEEFLGLSPAPREEGTVERTPLPAEEPRTPPPQAWDPPTLTKQMIRGERIDTVITDEVLTLKRDQVAAIIEALPEKLQPPKSEAEKAKSAPELSWQAFLRPIRDANIKDIESLTVEQLRGIWAAFWDPTFGSEVLTQDEVEELSASVVAACRALIREERWPERRAERIKVLRKLIQVAKYRRREYSQEQNELRGLEKEVRQEKFQARWKWADMVESPEGLRMIAKTPEQLKAEEAKRPGRFFDLPQAFVPGEFVRGNELLRNGVLAPYSPLYTSIFDKAKAVSKDLKQTLERVWEIPPTAPGARFVPGRTMSSLELEKVARYAEPRFSMEAVATGRRRTLADEQCEDSFEYSMRAQGIDATRESKEIRDAVYEQVWRPFYIRWINDGYPTNAIRPNLGAAFAVRRIQMEARVSPEVLKLMQTYPTEEVTGATPSRPPQDPSDAPMYQLKRSAEGRLSIDPRDAICRQAFINACLKQGADFRGLSEAVIRSIYLEDWCPYYERWMARNAPPDWILDLRGIAQRRRGRGAQSTSDRARDALVAFITGEEATVVPAPTYISGTIRFADEELAHPSGVQLRKIDWSLD